MKNDISSRRKRRYKRANRTHSKRGKKFILVIIAGLVFVAAYNFLFTKEDKEVITEKAEEIIEEVKEPVVVEEPEFDPEAKVKEAIAAYAGTDISVSYIDLKKPSEVKTYGLTQSFLGASTTKLISATCMLREIEAGQYTLKSPLGGSTVEWQIKQMINQSNNNSWALIISKVGSVDLGNCAKSLGLTNFRTYNNSVTSRDIAVILREIYLGRALSAEHRELLMSFMQNTNNETLIPPALPENYKFWHKYGDYSGHLHDAAIIKDGDREFILVVYTNRDAGTNYVLQTEIIQKIAKVFVRK